MNCKNCNNEVDLSKLGQYASGEFCCKECARSYSTKNDNKNETKKATCIICNKEILINKRSSIKNCKCNECKIKKHKIKKCGICGQENCLRLDICKKYQLFPSLIKYFGFDKNKIGTIDVYEEFDRIRNLLIEDYWDNELSLPDIKEKYNYIYSRNLNKIFNSLDIKRRTFSECTANSIIHNKFINPKYKNGWHITWKGDRVFYRSSYELEYALLLDEQKIDYQMENLRIVYWDTQKLHQRIAVPDFYLPESNTIVEIKSSYTYDEQNMSDKIKSYKEHGYNFKLILDKEEIITAG